MAITTLDQLVDALGNGASRLVVDKGSLGNAAAGQLISLWRATGQPAQGAIPGAAALCTNATTGAPNFTQQTAPATSYLGWLALQSSNNTQTIEVHDRIAASGGGVLNVTTAQTAPALDLVALAPPADRLGDADYSDVQWFLEVYTDGGATASNATIAVTYNDNSTGNLTALAVGGTLRAGRMIPLTPQIPVADQGKRIRAITSITLSASTTVAGSFGFTVTRQRTVLPLILANKTESADWAGLGLPGVPNGAALQFVVLTSQTTTGTLRGQGKIIHG